MSKSKKILVFIILLFTAALVYAPHFSYPLPYHIDEWHHISEGIRLGNYGEYFRIFRLESANRFSGLEIGFHFFLFLLSNLVDLVSIYQFLPAFWAALGGLTIFLISYHKTKKYWLAILAMIFFAAIKSNVNISGLWFFTPLSFSLPLIMAYLYLWSEGLARQNKTYLLLCLVIILLLIPTHSISVLFAAPLLLIVAAFNSKYLLRQWKFFSLFIIVPIIGFLFYKYALGLDWLTVFKSRFYFFEYGWGIVELKNSLTESYPLIAYLLACLGLGFIILTHQTKKFILWLVWPLSVLTLIIIYRLTGISLLSPYQRNIYYLTLSLPLLSAFGLFYLLVYLNRAIAFIIENRHTNYIKKFISISVTIGIDQKYIKLIQSLISAVVIVIVFTSTFWSYYQLPQRVSLYKIIDNEEYAILKYLSRLAPAKIMAPPFISAAIFPLSGHEPVGTYVFYGNIEDVRKFFSTDDCQSLNEILNRHQVSYIIAPLPLLCNYELLQTTPNRFIYKVNVHQN